MYHAHCLASLSDLHDRLCLMQIMLLCCAPQTCRSCQACQEACAMCAAHSQPMLSPWQGHARPSEFARHATRFISDSCLQDVLAICGSSLPPWTHALATSCKFLFPFDLRRRFFYCTSFGLARALQHLQQQQAAEGGAPPPASRDSRELRVGRLQRQKVMPAYVPASETLL